MKLEQIGPYRIVRRIGRGGMAEVFLARVAGADGFEREVVVKRVLPALAHEQEFIDMFRDEARITAQLRHGNIAQVLDFREHDGQYYLLLEYVDGASLANILADGAARKVPLPHAVVAHVLSEVARALDYAHRKRGADGGPLGVVHRDVSPSNVLVSRDGEVKLTDFGIARASGRVSETTTGGRIKGKFSYMAPEAVFGEATVRSDLYALGVMGWEMLAGARPFATPTNEAQLVHQATATARPIGEVVSGVPQPLADMVMRLVNRDPEVRPARAAIVADTLGAVVSASERSVQEILAERVVETPRTRPMTTPPPSRKRAPRDRHAEVTEPEGPAMALVVDSSPTARALLKRALDGVMPVVEGADFDEGLGIARSRRIALVLAQYLLGGGRTGMDLCRELRRHVETEHVTFALAVFEATPAIEQEAREAGVNLVVSKSDPKALLRVVRELAIATA